MFNLYPNREKTWVSEVVDYVYTVSAKLLTKRTPADIVIDYVIVDMTMNTRTLTYQIVFTYTIAKCLTFENLGLPKTITCLQSC